MKLRHLIVGALLITAGAGCDFQAAEDAFESFDVVIELEPINTVINGIVADNNGELIDARLTFSGSGAGVLIDAYSDPISTLNAEGGLVTFGIDNGVVPSQGAPFEVTVTATADGFFTAEETVSISALGEGTFTVTMVSSNIINAQARGTQSTQDSGTSTDSNGAVTQTRTVQTQQTAQTTATAALTVAQGVRPLTASGQPLSGSLTTQLRSYDSGTGLQALPAGARLSGDGTNQAVGGAVFFKMSDGSGNVAVSAEATGGIVAGKSAGTCSGMDFSLKSTDSALIGLFTLLGPVGVDVYAFTPADGANPKVASSVLEADGAGVKVDFCVGGVSGDTGLVNTAAIGNASAGIIYTFAIPAALATTGPLGATVTVGGFSGEKTIAFSIAGPGISETAQTAVTGGSSYSLSTLVQSGSSVFSAVNAGTYIVSANYPGSTVLVSESVASGPLAGSASITMPTSTGLETYSVTASLQCDNPATQEFEIQITEQSLDAVSVFYRINGSGNSWTLLPTGGITKTVTDASIEVAGSIDLKPATAYAIRGVLGTDSSESVESTPASGGNWDIDLSTDDIGIDCKDR